MKKTLSILLVFVLAFSGCAKTESAKDSRMTDATETTIESKEETTESTTEETTTETTVETTKATTEAPAPFEFNPHVYSKILSDEFVKEEWWESLYNMIDAIRAGEDTFKCSDKEAYAWCTDSVTTSELFPPACTLVEGDGFENGVAKLKYTMDKEEFLKKEKAFEEEITRMINEAIRTDYSDFEKIFGLYDYMTKECVYQHIQDSNETFDTFSTYACLMSKNGICTEFAGAYAYLLLQVGVDALEIGEQTQMCHAWTYVSLNGQGYHVDVTWGLRESSPDGSLVLKYLLETDDERIADGMDVPNADLSLVQYWCLINNKEYDMSKYRATDTTYTPLHNEASFVGIDMENNAIKYIPMHGSNEWTLTYEEQ